MKFECFDLGVGVSLGSAVTASMNLTNTTESLEPAVQVAYKTESTSDMQLYYQVTPQCLSSITSSVDILSFSFVCLEYHQ